MIGSWQLVEHSLQGIDGNCGLVHARTQVGGIRTPPILVTHCGVTQVYGGRMSTTSPDRPPRPEGRENDRYKTIYARTYLLSECW